MFEVGDKVHRAGRPKVLGEVKHVQQSGIHRFGVQYPGRAVLAYYSEDELEIAK